MLVPTTPPPDGLSYVKVCAIAAAPAQSHARINCHLRLQFKGMKKRQRSEETELGREEGVLACSAGDGDGRCSYW